MPTYGKRETRVEKTHRNTLKKHNLHHGMNSSPPYPQVTNPLNNQNSMNIGCIKDPAKLCENVGEPTAIDPIEFE